MGFAQDTGYVPATIDQIMDSIMAGVNTQFGTTYIKESFLGTNFYKYLYAAAQRIQLNEIKTSEIFLRMQEYFEVTNEKVLRPNTTHPGVQDYFADAGYLASTKPPEDADAGKAFVCVDVDETLPNYATLKKQICNMIKDCVVAGVVSQGTEVETIVLDNGQAFDFKFNLPDRIPIKLRLTLTQSENNLFTVGDAGEMAQLLERNIRALYKLGKNFEPQRYFSVADAPWTQTVLLEYSTDGGSTWASTVYDSDYDELFTFALADISVVEV